MGFGIVGLSLCEGVNNTGLVYRDHLWLRAQHWPCRCVLPFLLCWPIWVCSSRYMCVSSTCSLNPFYMRKILLKYSFSTYSVPLLCFPFLVNPIIHMLDLLWLCSFSITFSKICFYFFLLLRKSLSFKLIWLKILCIVIFSWVPSHLVFISEITFSFFFFLSSINRLLKNLIFFLISHSWNFQILILIFNSFFHFLNGFLLLFFLGKSFCHAFIVMGTLLYSFLFMMTMYGIQLRSVSTAHVWVQWVFLITRNNGKNRYFSFKAIEFSLFFLNEIMKIWPPTEIIRAFSVFCPYSSCPALFGFYSHQFLLSLALSWKEVLIC